jgi:hypothetical protein
VLVGGGAKVTPLVYRVDPGKPAPLLMSKLEPGTQLNTVEWAPQGGWLAVFGTNAPSGNLIFIETGGAEAARFRLIENPMMSQVLNN